MKRGHFTENCKLDAAKQITEQEPSVIDAPKCLDVSWHWLYGRMERYAASPIAVAQGDQSAQISSQIGFT
jgi:hypothetical protein